MARKEKELTDPIKSLDIFIEVSYNGAGNYSGSKHLRNEDVTAKNEGLDAMVSLTK